MSVRSRFAAARARPFVHAAEDYLERIRDDRRGDIRVRDARELQWEVLKQLGTDDHDLIYRFAHFVGLSLHAGVDPMVLCFDPPVGRGEAHVALASATRGWITGDGALRDPVRQGHQTSLGGIPELCCFGFIAIQVLGARVMYWLKFPDKGDAAAYAAAFGGDPAAFAAAFEGDAATFAAAFNTDLASAIAELRAKTGLSAHHARALFRLVKTLEEIAGSDFSLSQLTDDQVLESWKRTAVSEDPEAKKGPTSFRQHLRQLAVLSAEVWASIAQDQASQPLSVDEPAVGNRLSEEEGLGGNTDGIGAVLSDSLLVELLSHEQKTIIRQQLEKLADLPELYLSRARAVTFDPLENRVVQAKRDRRDASAIVSASDPDVSHAVTLTRLTGIVDKLDAFIHAAIHVLWENGRRIDALSLATRAGLLPGEEALALARPEPAGRWAEVLWAGRGAWHKLRRRAAFSGVDSSAPALEQMENAAGQATHLRHALAQLRVAVDGAVADRRDGPGFDGEYDTFCTALAHVHGFDFSSRIPQ